MPFARFSLEREFFWGNNKNNFAPVRVRFPSLKVGSGLNLDNISFLKPCSKKNFADSSSFPFLALSNGGLFFYDSAYNNFFFNLNQSGVLLFDDLYSFKNKIVF